MKISLIHPSRGRAEKAHKTFMHWLLCSSLQTKIEHILSVDSDDADLSKYKLLFQRSVIVENDNKNLVEAANHGAKAATGDILIYMSDDFVCPDEWDVNLITIFSGENGKNPLIIKVDDCLQKFDVDIITIPIMNRALYNKLGYFWHPEYKSMFVDQDLFWTCKNNGWLIVMPELKYAHHHYCNGKAAKDATYMRSNEHWDSGKLTYQKRKAANFPL